VPKNRRKEGKVLKEKGESRKRGEVSTPYCFLDFLPFFDFLDFFDFKKNNPFFTDFPKNSSTCR